MRRKSDKLISNSVETKNASDALQRDPGRFLFSGFGDGERERFIREARRREENNGLSTEGTENTEGTEKSHTRDLAADGADENAGFVFVLSASICGICG
jgi:hypothetical protein